MAKDTRIPHHFFIHSFRFLSIPLSLLLGGLVACGAQIGDTGGYYGTGKADVPSTESAPFDNSTSQPGSSAHESGSSNNQSAVPPAASDGVAPGEPQPEPEPAGTQWIQLSTDDSTSMASAQIYKGGMHYLPYGASLKAHEFINYYDPPASLYSQESWAIDEGIGSTMRVGLKAQNTEANDEIEVLFQLQADPVATSTRRNWNTILCVDVSGSMGGEKIEYVRDALALMLDHFKTGDRLTLVTFNSDAKIVFENLDFATQENEIRNFFANLSAGSATNMLAGLDLAYALAQNLHDPTMVNRVLLFSDGAANVGNNDIEGYQALTRLNEEEGIYLSGIGVGQNYDIERMDRLTDAGKGGHVFLPNADEVNLIFGDYFPKLMEVAADEISIEMELPAGIHLAGFSGEEVSTNPEERLQSIVLAAGDDLTFLASFEVTREAALEEPALLRVKAKPLSTGTTITHEIQLDHFSDLLADGGALFQRTSIIQDFAQYAIDSQLGITPDKDSLQVDIAAYQAQHGPDLHLSEILDLLD